MSTAKTNIVVLLGGGLLVANVAFDKTFDSVRQDVSSGTASIQTVNTSPVKMIVVGLLTLLVLSVIADDSDSAANTCIVALLSLWVLWLISYNNDKGKLSASQAPSTSTGTPLAASFTQPTKA